MTLAIGVVWFHRNIHHKDCLSAVVSIFGILATFLVVALVPVDVFLVSYFKYSNGTYRVSATQTYNDQTCCWNIVVVLGVGFFKYDKKWFDGRSIVHVLRYQFLTLLLSEIVFKTSLNFIFFSFSALFSCICAFIFIILPLSYFFLEEVELGRELTLANVLQTIIVWTPNAEYLMKSFFLFRGAALRWNSPSFSLLEPFCFFFLGLYLTCLLILCFDVSWLQLTW